MGSPVNEFRLGTRGSALALWQAEWIRGLLRAANPDLKPSIVKVKTHGDIDQRTPLARSSERGVFVKALEDALLAGQIDAAVHSMKDVPTEIPEGLEIAAVAPRGDPREALISPERRALRDLPHGATLATGSPRRRAQLAHYRRDFRFVDVRGNLDTRLRKLAQFSWDGLVVAYAGVKRLGFQEQVSDVLTLNVVLPAAGQGAVGVEIRADDKHAREVVATVRDPASEEAVAAERAFLRGVGGGCATPVAVFASVRGGRLEITGLVADVDGRDLVRARLFADARDPEAAGLALAEQVLSQGGKELLRW